MLVDYNTLLSEIYYLSGIEYVNLGASRFNQSLVSL
jgi:hypothetical protein